uniref:Putative reverse transcriptase domain-containing protein n=1 Tax=Tanacetum cinerariifolium TaxID=118510 RepID=A0A6L2JD97_TANCI|nr:putative reverse transcriptase domain-containing protein [Tanacetum cinerariifolium]
MAQKVFLGRYYGEESAEKGSPGVIVYGYNGLLMQPVATPSLDFVPGPEHPPSLNYVPSPEHPPSLDEKDSDDEEEEEEHLAPSDSSVVPIIDPISQLEIQRQWRLMSLHLHPDHFILLSLFPRHVSVGHERQEESAEIRSPGVIVYGYNRLLMQPVATPSLDFVPGPEHPPSLVEIPYEDYEEDHVDYPADGGDGDGDDEPSDDDDDDDDMRIRRIRTVRLEPPMSASIEACIARHATLLSPPLPIPSPPLPLPSPLTTSPTDSGAPLGYRAAGIRMRVILLFTSRRTKIPKAATGYMITNICDEIVDTLMEIAPTTLEGVNQRVINLDTSVRQRTDEFETQLTTTLGRIEILEARDPGPQEGPAEAGRSALTWWNSHMRGVGQDVAYAMPWAALKRMITDKYCPRESAKVESHSKGIMWHGLTLLGWEIRSLMKEPNLYVPSAIITMMGPVHQSVPTVRRLLIWPVTVKADLLLPITITTPTTTTTTREPKVKIQGASLALNVEFKTDPNSNVVTDHGYDVELANGRIIWVNTLIRGCTLNFLNHPFNLDLMLVEMAVLTSLSRKAKDKSKEKRLEDVPIVQDFPEVFSRTFRRIQAARDCKKSYADVRLKPLKFQVGDRVMLKVSPWKGVVRFGKRGKLNPRYIGPFKCLSDEPLAILLDEIHIDEKLGFIEEPLEIMDHEVKRLKQSRIPIIKFQWNSRIGPKFIWEREDQFWKKYP